MADESLGHGSGAQHGIEIESGVHTGLRQHVHDLLGGDVAARPRGERAAAEPSDRGVELGDAGPELATIEADLHKTNQSIDRYLNAFENGKLEEDDLASRLTSLKIKTKQLRTRRDELTDKITDVPAAPPAASLREVANFIADIISSGTDNQRKALIETLIAEIRITAADRIIPIFRITQPPSAEAALNKNEALTRGKSLVRASTEGVRAMTNSVELRRLEPLTP